MKLINGIVVTIIIGVIVPLSGVYLTYQLNTSRSERIEKDICVRNIKMLILEIKENLSNVNNATINPNDYRNLPIVPLPDENIKAAIQSPLIYKHSTFEYMSLLRKYNELLSEFKRTIETLHETRVNSLFGKEKYFITTEPSMETMRKNLIYVSYMLACQSKLYVLNGIDWAVKHSNHNEIMEDLKVITYSDNTVDRDKLLKGIEKYRRRLNELEKKEKNNAPL